jgi:hypothetical protein
MITNRKCGIEFQDFRIALGCNPWGEDDAIVQPTKNLHAVFMDKVFISCMLPDSFQLQQRSTDTDLAVKSGTHLISYQSEFFFCESSLFCDVKKNEWEYKAMCICEKAHSVSW